MIKDLKYSEKAKNITKIKGFVFFGSTSYLGAFHIIYVFAFKIVQIYHKVSKLYLLHAK